MRAPVAPTIPALVGSVPNQLRVLADAVSRKADVTSEPFYSAVMLQAPDGSVWRVAIDDTGALITAQVPR